MGWSKEHIEHLRTVHFSLIVVATGLIVLVLSAKKFDPVRALAELEEILELKSEWSPMSVKRFGAGEVKQGSDCRNDDTDHFVQCKTQFDPSYMPERDLVRRIILNNNPLRFPFQTGDLIAFQLPVRNWSFVAREKGVHWSPDSFPNTLAEFRQWWTDLGEKPYELDFPFEVATKGGKITWGNADIGELRETEVGNDEPGKPAGRFPLEFLRDDKTGTFSFDSFDSNKATQIFNYEIPVTSVLHVTISQQSISAQFQNLSPASFENSFADLQAAALSYQNVPLAKLESFLHDDASKGYEVFEALGIKIPADQIKLWGIVVLMGIQFYYFASLKSVARGSAIDPAARAIPWLGLNANPLSRYILFVTTVLLPVAAVVLLLWKNSADKAHVQSLWNSVSYFAVLIGSIVLALGSWVYRPRPYSTEELQYPMKFV